MAKDRNTFAKRQREAEKKRKRDDKRKRRAEKKTTDDQFGDESSGSLLSPAERAVLDVFQKYLMTPGKMLCFSKADLETFDAPLVQLTDKGMVVADKFEGGFSLSESGFAAMTANEQSRRPENS